MNLFTSIKWDNFNLQQSGFLEDDYIRKHSFTYRFLSDEFKVPKHSKKLTNHNPGDDKECCEDESEHKEPIAEDKDGGGSSCRKRRVDIDDPDLESDHRLNTKKYIAGLVGGLPFPKHSSLTKEEQSQFIQLHTKFLSKTLMVASNITAEQQKQFAIYIELNNRVMAERAEYLAFLKDHWKIQSIKFSRLSTDVERYVSTSWKHRVDTRLSSYMRFFSKTKLIPLVYQGEKSDIQLIAGDALLQLGSSALIIHPTFKNKVQVRQDAVTKRYPPDCKIHDIDTSNTIHKLPVSKDVNARQLALAYEADLVISSSGLKAIADNHSDYGSLWDLPVVVERYEPVSASDPPRTVAYVDRPLPRRNMTVVERCRQYHKLGVKTVWCHPKHHKSFRFQAEREVEGDGNEGSGGNCKEQKRRKIEMPDSQEGSKADAELNVTETATGSGENVSPRSTFLEPAPLTNVNYRLWTMKKEKERKEELPRHMLKQSGAPDKELRILVRNKLDGFVSIGRNREVRSAVTVLPKLEFQSEFGAEKMTRSELTNEWLSLKFRPGSTLTRARVNAETSEVLVAESLTLEQVTQDAKQTCGATFVSEITSTLYSVLNGLIGLSPGQYLLSHSNMMQAFAMLQKGQQDFGNVDLKAIYSTVDTGVDPTFKEEMPWIEVDTNFSMPYHAVFGRVPGTFNPLVTIKPSTKSSTPKQPPKVTPAKKKKKKDKKKKGERASAKATNKRVKDLECPGS